LALALLLVVIVLWVRFGLGCLKLAIPFDLVDVSRGRIISTRLLSAGVAADQSTSIASNVTLAFSSLETGQPALALPASSSNFAWSDADYRAG
jgi:hypothetical protein